MSQKFKENKPEDEESGGLNFKLPDTTRVLGNLASASQSLLRQEHNQAMDDEDKEDQKKGKKPKKRQKRSNAICFCGNPVCRIGPFTETEESSEDKE